VIAERNALSSQRLDAFPETVQWSLWALFGVLLILNIPG